MIGIISNEKLLPPLAACTSIALYKLMMKASSGAASFRILLFLSNQPIVSLNETDLPDAALSSDVGLEFLGFLL